MTKIDGPSPIDYSAYEPTAASDGVDSNKPTGNVTHSRGENQMPDNIEQIAHAIEAGVLGAFVGLLAGGPVGAVIGGGMAAVAGYNYEAPVKDASGRPYPPEGPQPEKETPPKPDLSDRVDGSKDYNTIDEMEQELIDGAHPANTTYTPPERYT